ncbi:MAG: DUF349 domain-containing protein [Bacteroidales bacterium]|jgi:hypothetical protein|nr:DUF349 domain-containing protein [Bacteroidales bacterium]
MSENLDPIQQEENILPTEPAAAPEVAEPIAETESAEDTIEKKIYASRSEILERMAEIAGIANESVKGELNYLKLLYYKMRQQETDAEMQAFIDGNGDPAQYESKPDELEPRLKDLLNIQKEARAAMVKARDEEFANNLAQKREVLAKMEVIASNAEEVGQKYNEFQELQKQFKEIGAVDQQEVAGLWKRYAQLTEQFYDALKINKELRDYDFRKNLEAKLQICEEAEKLTQASDVVDAFRKLQEMHEQWRIIGPVAPSVREEIWNRFKAASTEINKRHQVHFEQLKAQEHANEVGKTAICEKVEAIDLSQITSVKGWDDATKVILAFQEEWRKLGFASKRVNTQLFERFRQSCDNFFNQKAEFFKSVRGEQSDNLQKKIALCERAEELSTSTDWRKTTDQLIALQNEWKTIGPAPRKYSQQIWERFKSACDAFFKAKEEAVGGERATERANFERKQEIILALTNLKDDVENATAKGVRDLMNQWAEIGHVPFREKDKLQAKYKELIDFFYEKLDMKGQRRRLDNFKERVSSIKDSNSLQRKLERLMNDLKTYENNLGFLNAKSKNGNGLVALMQSKMDELKKEIAELKKRIEDGE